LIKFNNEELYNFLLGTKYYQDEQMEECDLGKACNQHERDKKYIENLLENLKE
jgi:hypothetical protein